VEDRGGWTMVGSRRRKVSLPTDRVHDMFEGFKQHRGGVQRPEARDNMSQGFNFHGRHNRNEELMWWLTGRAGEAGGERSET